MSCAHDPQKGSAQTGNRAAVEATEFISVTVDENPLQVSKSEQTAFTIYFSWSLYLVHL